MNYDGELREEISKQLSILSDLINKAHPLMKEYVIRFDWQNDFEISVEDFAYRYIREEDRK